MNVKVLRIALPLLAVALLFSQGVSAQTQATSGGMNMTCFPPPPPPHQPIGIGSLPPCVIPVGLPPQFISAKARGRMSFMVNPDNTVTFHIKIQGLAPNMVVSAWLVWYFPGLETPPDPIFIGTPPVADLSVPLAATNSAWVNGLGTDPNRLTTDGGTAEINTTLDYNPFEKEQGPLRNAMLFVNQSLAPAGNIAFQPLCCPGGTGYDPVGAGFLRMFDPTTGFQLVGTDGLPELIRSPVPGAFIAIVSHLDLQTHGIVAGIPILPIPGQAVSSGDHFLIGMFDLRRFEQ